MAEGDVRALVHELQVHQIELEMQNAELRRAGEESQRQYRTLVEGADIGITLIDPAFNIVMTNTKQAAFVGRRPDELIGKKCFDEFGGLDAVCPDCQGLKAMASGIPAVSERTGTRKDGTAFAVRVQGLAPVR